MCLKLFLNNILYLSIIILKFNHGIRLTIFNRFENSLKIECYLSELDINLKLFKIL